MFSLVSLEYHVLCVIHLKFPALVEKRHNLADTNRRKTKATTNSLDGVVDFSDT